MSTAMTDALHNAGYDTSGDEMFVLVSQMRAQGKSLRAIEDDVWKRCLRRPTLFGPIIASYVERVDADMSFRREPDGGHSTTAREGHERRAAESSALTGSPGHTYGAIKGQASIARDNSAGDGSGGHARLASNGHISGAAVNSREDLGRAVNANQAMDEMPASRDTISAAAQILSNEAHRQMKTRPPGAGAMQARAYETRARVFGESWLLSYAIPNGPRLLSIRAGEVRPMMRRLATEGAERAHSVLLLHAIGKELKALGQVDDSVTIEKILPPATVARIATAYAPENVIAAARDHFDRFSREFKLEDANAV